MSPTPHHRLSSPTDRVAAVHRVGAACAAVALAVFGVLGALRHLGPLDTVGTPVLGLTTNGLLSLISMVVAAVLLGSAAAGGPTASTVTAVVGVAFLVSGLVNMALLGTWANILAFTFPNVVFSLVMGIALLTVGVYGRFSGALPVDNPYRQARDRRRAATSGIVDGYGTGETAGGESDELQRWAQLQRWVQLERRFADGEATPEESAEVLHDLQVRSQLAHDQAWVRVGIREPRR